MITTLLFDLDGTLINTNPLIIKTFKDTLRHFLPNQDFTEEMILDYIGPTLEQTFNSLLPEKCDEMISHYRKINISLHDSMVNIYPTVKEGLELLKNKGYHLGIVSSKMHDMVIHGLKHCKIDKYFELVIGADDVDNPKPNPEPLYKAMEKLRCQPKNVIYIGDNSHDILAGKNANVVTVCVSWALRGAQYLKQYKPDYILEDMKDLINIIEEVNHFE